GMARAAAYSSSLFSFPRARKFLFVSGHRGISSESQSVRSRFKLPSPFAEAVWPMLGHAIRVGSGRLSRYQIARAFDRTLSRGADAEATIPATAGAMSHLS